MAECISAYMCDVIDNNGTKGRPGKTGEERLSGICRESYSVHYIDTSTAPKECMFYT